MGQIVVHHPTNRLPSRLWGKTPEADGSVLTLFPLIVSEVVLARMPRAVARWCNGSTRDFGSLCLGSNPSRALVNIRKV